MKRRKRIMTVNCNGQTKLILVTKDEEERANRLNEDERKKYIHLLCEREALEDLLEESLRRRKRMEKLLDHVNNLLDEK